MCALNTSITSIKIKKVRLTQLCLNQHNKRQHNTHTHTHTHGIETKKSPRIEATMRHCCFHYAKEKIVSFPSNLYQCDTTPKALQGHLHTVGCQECS